MAGQNLNQLLEKAKEAMRKNEPFDCFLQLKESLSHDYYWEAMSMELKGKDMDNLAEVKTIGYGQTPEEALNELIEKLNNLIPQYKNNKLWAEIMKNAESGEHGLVATINTVDLRQILEKYDILEQEKGM